MNHGHSGLAHGTSGSPQMTLENTELATKSKELENRLSAPIKNSGDLRYDRRKTENYLLNLSHPHGGHKAKFMKDVLGYLQSDARLFHKNIVQAVKGKTPSKTEVTPYGTKHTFHTILKGKNGKHVSANVVVVVQKNNKRLTYRIITAYPDKKGGK